MEISAMSSCKATDKEYNRRRLHGSLGFSPAAPEAIEDEKFTQGLSQ